MALCFGQNVFNPVEFTQTLNFEIERLGPPPAGWGGGPPNTLHLDREIVHGGKSAARIERNAESANAFSVLTKVLPVDFSGKTIELRGFMRTEDVTEYSGLWMRLDGDEGMLALENMQSRQIKGTTPWTEYSIKLPLQVQARQVFFGALSSGTGKTWVDDLQMLVDGKPVWEAPKVERPKTIIDQDHEFDKGSTIRFTQLTPVQVENLKTLGKVWGFLKYHHPLITEGKQHWDFALFRALPSILAAANRSDANQAMAKWIASIGEVADCTTCAKLDDSKIHLRPQSAWLSDTAALGAELSKALLAIHRNRPAGRRQFYVSLNPAVGNPSFDHELAYGQITLPDPGFQLLALYRFWNIIEYWFPYRDVIGENWDTVLSEFIPRVALAKTSETYQQEMMALIARVKDTHANLWSSINVRPPVGNCMIPAVMRFAENQAVVASAEPGTALKPGDILMALDDKPVPELVREWSPYYAASNEPTRLRDIAEYMTRGKCGPASLRIKRGVETLELKADREQPKAVRRARTHDRPGDTFQRLSKDTGYLKLSSVKAASAASYIDSAAGTKGLIIDIRNYPSEFMVFTLGSLLVDRETAFVTFTRGDPANPGAFHWTETMKLQPAKPHYSGKVIILVDEVSQSQSEYTTMAFRSSPRAKVIGSTTAGADGNVSAIPLPGGFRSMISGIGVFYPDKKPTQRIGILPDIEVKATIAGIRDGRDEVLEEAIRQIEQMPEQ